MFIVGYSGLHNTLLTFFHTVRRKCIWMWGRVECLDWILEASTDENRFSLSTELR